MYIIGTIAPDIDGDGGNTLIVKTFSIKIKRKGREPIIIAPLAPVSMFIYSVFGHRAVMHWPETWILISYVMFNLGVPLIWCYFFFLGCIMHLLTDAPTIGGLPVPPTIKYLVVLPLQLIRRLRGKDPYKSIPFIWERKGFPPKDLGRPTTFQDIVYENRFFITPKFMRFRVGTGTETLAVLIIMGIFLLLLDPLGNFKTGNLVTPVMSQVNGATYNGFQKVYNFLSFVKDNSGGIKNKIGSVAKSVQTAASQK